MWSYSCWFTRGLPAVLLPRKARRNVCICVFTPKQWLPSVATTAEAFSEWIRWNKNAFKLSEPLLWHLKVLWSQPRSSALHEGRRGQLEEPSVLLRFLGLRHKFPVSTATSPPRSGHSPHLEGGQALVGGQQTICFPLQCLYEIPPDGVITLFELQVPSFHHTNFAVIDRTGRLCRDRIYRVLKRNIFFC